MNLPDPIVSSLLVIIAGGLGFVIRQLLGMKDMMHSLDKRLAIVETQIGLEPHEIHKRRAHGHAAHS